MPVVGIFGAQWGDEGKGRMADYYVEFYEADIVIKTPGGDNAGHTVENEYGKFVLHLIPSGIFNPKTMCVLGTGMVVNPESLLSEMDTLTAKGISLKNLYISNRAHLVLPHHIYLDGARENGANALGSTKKGISPAYSDKALKLGIRFSDLQDVKIYEKRLDILIDYYSRFINYPLIKTYKAELMALYEKWKVLIPKIIDMTSILEFDYSNKTVIIEGQLGIMRDLDWGIYPYCTSSNTFSGSIITGAGIAPNKITEIIGVAKAYSTSVGGGPFPVGLNDRTGQKLRDLGHEYGATTGRPRQCGWFDAVATKYSVLMNGFTSIALTKLDILDTFEEIKICVGYMVDGSRRNYVPSTEMQERAVPIYETMQGWMTSTTHIRDWESLPENAKLYIRRLERLINCRINRVSVGPERSQIIERGDDPGVEFSSTTIR